MLLRHWGGSDPDEPDQETAVSFAPHFLLAAVGRLWLCAYGCLIFVGLRSEAQLGDQLSIPL